ncbi:MAG: hypothetical protein HYR60_28165 [Acidobacteria bacterium]|nr:hypothetical protein [Acidobacteriota bacterium]
MRIVVLPLLLGWTLAIGQTPVVLVVDIDNAVQYRSDVADPTRRGTDESMTTAGAARAFTDVLFVGDIVAVNGKTARGLWTSRQFLMNFNPAPQPGFGVADVNRGTLADCKWEFLDADGQFVGAIMDSGYFPHAVVGGAGAFLGIRGQMSGGTPPNPRPIRVASMAEDPGKRRAIGGGTSRIVFHLLPAFRPEVIAVFDSSFRPITPANPARKGEILIASVTGLGPTRPGTIPAGAEPFTRDPLLEVNSPVEVLVQGRPAEVLNKIGWPGETDVYRVDFRVPDDTVSGPVNLQLTAAWIPGTAMRLPVR